MVNGSLNGTLLGTACEQVMQVSAHLSTRTFLGVTKGIRVGFAKVWFTGDYGSYCPVFEGWAKIWFNNAEWKAAAPTTGKSFDIIPGSYFSTQQEIADQGSGFASFFKWSSLGTVTYFNVIKPNHSFIPTMSALAMNIAGQDLSQNLSNRNLVRTGETPFQSYHGDNINHDHITFTPENVVYVKSELNRQSSPSPYPIQIISGYEPICTNTATYGIANLPANSTVCWGATPTNVVAINPTCGLQTTATRLNNGTATLTANITLCTGETYVATKSIRVGGYSSSDYPISGPSTVGCGQYVYYNTNELPGATYYNWGWPSEWQYVSGQGSRFLTLYVPSYVQYGGAVTVRVANACDAGGSPAFLYVQVNCWGGYFYSVAPNPASSEVNVSVKEETENKAAKDATITEVIIYDQQGNVKKQQKYNKLKKASLNISNLPTGMYIIEITDGQRKERQQLSVQK